MKHSKLLFSLLMDPFIYLCARQKLLLFLFFFIEDEGHPVDTRQRPGMLRNNCSAKSRKDLTTKAISLSIFRRPSTGFVVPRTVRLLICQKAKIVLASPTSAVPEREFKALSSLTENSSSAYGRPDSSRPKNISAWHLFVDVRDAHPSAEALKEHKYVSFLHQLLLLLHWLV